MTDLVKRLRELGACEEVADEAADHIETQAREIERLRAALGFATRTLEAEGFSDDGFTLNRIRTALAGDSHSRIRPSATLPPQGVYDYGGASIEGVEAEYRAAAVIEADRAATITAKDAEIAALQAHADALAKALSLVSQRCGELANDGKIARQALRAYEEFRR